MQWSVSRGKGRSVQPLHVNTTERPGASGTVVKVFDCKRAQILGSGSVWPGPGALAKVEMQGFADTAAAQAPARLGPVDPQSSQGKALYVGNLHSSVSQDMLQVLVAVAHICHPHVMSACECSLTCVSDVPDV